MSTKRQIGAASAMLNRVGAPLAMGSNRLHVHVPEAVMHSFAKRASLIWWRVGINPTAGWETPPA